MKNEKLLAEGRKTLWAGLLENADEFVSAAPQIFIDAGMLVPAGGAAELARLQSLMNAQPADLSEEQLGALIDAGNGALSDYYHERACACSEYPAGCATNPQYRREFGYWDTDAFAVGLGAVLAVWEVMRAAGDAGEVGLLKARVAELEAAAGDGATRTADEDPLALELTPRGKGCGSVRDVLPCVLDEDHDGPVHRDLNGYEWPTAGALSRSVRPQVQDLRALLARQREDTYTSPLHHDYRVSHDLPEVTP